MLSIILVFIFALTQLASGNDCSNHGSYGRIIGGHLVPIEDKGKVLVECPKSLKMFKLDLT